MLTENGHDPEDCRALNDVVARIGDRWTMLVIGALGGGPQRFSQLRRVLIGITQRMLTHTLRGLERDGLVTRTVHNTVPPAVDYALTSRGQELLVPIYALASWGRAHRDGIMQSRQQYDQLPSTETDQTGIRIYRLSMR